MALIIVDDDAFSHQNGALYNNLDRIVGQIFRLLPIRENGDDYIKPLNTLIVELAGYSWLVPDDKKLEALLAKLRGMKSQECEDDFMLFRRMVFEACSLTTAIKESIQEGES